MNNKTRVGLLSLLLFFISLNTRAIPHAIFGYTVTSEHCHYKAVSFSNTSTGATSYQWSFGNGASSVFATPVAYYSSVGTYTVRLIATDGPGNHDTAYTTITVPPGVYISYEASDTAICPWSLDTFNNTSYSTVAGAISYNWLINGVAFTSASPVYQFVNSGYYSVYLTATNSAGCSETSVRNNYVHVYNHSTLNFSANRTYLCERPIDTTRFTPTVTGFGPYSYLWLFGDGTMDTARKPLHTYVFDGHMAYTDSLIVTDGHGCKDTVRKSNYIHFDTMSAHFTVDTMLCRDVPITLHNTSTPTRRTSTWYFGDSTILSSDSITINHLYNFPGDKQVILSVVDSHCVHSDTQMIHIYKPNADFTRWPRVVCPNNPDHDILLTWMDSVRFWADTQYAAYSWLLGESETSTIDSPWVMFAPPGIKQITLAVTDFHGCRDTIVKLDTFLDMSLSIHMKSRNQRIRHGCAKDTIDFSGHVYSQVPYRTDIPDPLPYPDSIVFFSWNFGDTSLHSDTVLFNNQWYADTATGHNDTTTRRHIYRYPGTYHVKFSVIMGNGCTDSIEKEIIISKPVKLLPTTYFPDTVCYGSPVFFTPHIDTTTDTSIYSHTANFFWYFTDGLAGYSPNDPSTLSHIYDYPGTFMHDTLWANNDGCWIRQLIPDTVVVNGAKARIFYHFNCDTQLKVTFIDTSIGGGSRTWIFDDGTYSTLDSVSHVFASYGSHVTKLATYTDSSNCRDTATVIVNMPEPFASFATNDSSYCQSDSVVCTAPFLMSTFYTVFRWYVDGILTTSHLATNPYAYDFRYLFATPGYHTIKLEADNYRQCTDSFVRTVYVGNPVDSFSISPVIACSPDSVYFTDQSIAAPDRTIVSYKWLLTPVDSVTGVATTAHYYSGATTTNFKITETVTDSRGCIGQFTDSVTIVKDSAMFTTTPNDLFPCPGENITFNSTSSGARLKYLWRFGDGDSSTLKNPVHAYTVNHTDTFTVLLSVTDSVYGCTSTIRKVMTVTKPDITVHMDDSIAVCPPLNVHFSATNTEVGYPLTYLWTVFPSVSYTTATANFTYYTPGYNTITLVVTNNKGCKDTGIAHVKVFGYAGDFSTTTDSGCLPLPVTFNTGSAGGASVVWDFGDGSSAIDSTTVTHTYATPGTYVATLILLQDSCVSTSTDTVIVFPLPVVDTIAGAAELCIGDSAHLTNSTPGGTWHSSDSTIAYVGADGTLIGMSAGTAVISYTLVNEHGCSSFVTRTVIVHALPIPPPITGLPKECVTGTSTLYNDSTGGTWHSSNESVAIIDPVTGVVTGVSEGICTITYTFTSVFGCTGFITIQDTVINPPVPSAISGRDSVCIGDTAQLSNPDAGGHWASNNPGIADVDPATGVVTGYTAGTVDVSYILPTVCGDIISVYTIYVIDPASSIKGPSAVCSGNSIQLYDAAPDGVWTSSNTSVADVDPATGKVTGISFGSAVIIYSGTSICGYFRDTAIVLVDPAPVITTNFIVACQTMTDGGTASKGVAMGMDAGTGGPVLTTDPDGCLTACEGVIVRYYGNGVYSGMFTWTVTGGTIVGMYGDHNDSIDVLWPTAGVTGSVYMTDTFDHCTGSATLCIKVVSRPHASAEASSDGVCLGDQIAFFDESTADPASPIVTWLWDFGDGTSSGIQSPVHTYNDPGTYYVTLIVRNGCSCADTFHLKVAVMELTGPHISCASIVCENETTNYSLDIACDPVWTVTGGTIVDDDGDGNISVKWDDAPATGYGYVSVTNTCDSECNEPSIIKIPIILSNAQISGPTNACTGQQYLYSLPLWAATDYEWGVIDHPGIIIGFNNDHQMVVQFPTAGTYTIHAWYQNRLKLCGGNVNLEVTVLDATHIGGASSACFSSSDTYTFALGGGHIGMWTVTAPDASTTTTGPSNTVSFTTPVPGTYTINASGDFCVNPVTFTSIAPAPPIDSVVGPDTICLNRVYTYIAYNDVPGTVYSWQAVGGHVIPASGSNTVDVIWTDNGDKQLLVSHEPDGDPHCPAPVFIKNIIQEDINPVIDGDYEPCANSHRTYTSGYYRADNYEWKIFPDSVGSVISDNHSPDVRVLWNNAVGLTDAYLVLKVQKCDTSISDTFRVTVQPAPVVFMTADSAAACPGFPVNFAAHNGSGIYNWDFGDGSAGIINGGATANHLFPPNTTSGNITYVVRATSVVDSTDPCPAFGTAFFTMTILPGPVANATTASDSVWCINALDTAILVGTVTENIGGLTYQWYRNNVPIAVDGTDAIYTAFPDTHHSDFYFIVTAANGCKDTSDHLSFKDSCRVLHEGTGPGDPTTYPPPFGGSGPTCPGMTATATYICDQLTLTGVAGLGGTWIAYTTPLAGDSWLPNNTINADVAYAHYGLPGIYRFAYTADIPIPGGGTCRDTLYLLDTVGIVPNFRHSIRCAAGLDDSLLLSDYSVHVPWWHVDSNVWSAPLRVDEGSSTEIIRPAGGTYTITETVYGTHFTTPFTCSVTKAITVPARPPHFGFSFTPNNVCEGIPIHFTPDATAGIVSYLWSFGNGGTNVRQSPSCAYLWHGLSNPDNNTVLLEVVDTLGCKFDTTYQYAYIYRNDLKGQMDVDSTICPSMIPFTINYLEDITGSPTSYKWSIPDSTFVPYNVVYSTGAYNVKVYDNYGCQFRPDRSENIRVLKTPRVQIRGRLQYCKDENIQLNGYAGHGVSYTWYLNGGTWSTDPAISLGLDTGTYVFKLKLSMLDTFSGVICDDIDSVVVHVLPVPDPPVITGPVIVDCDAYHLQLSATASEAGTFNWSDGFPGPVDDIHTGGPYRVWFTNAAGCRSTADVLVPTNPQLFFQYLPTGCYDLCKGLLPLTLYGPPNATFNYWAWLMNGGVVSDGSDAMAPYTINGSGSYQWLLDNGLCEQHSDKLSLDFEGCTDCRQAKMDVTMKCDAGNPACYVATVNFSFPFPGTFTVGTDGGPVTPFSGSGSGFSSLTLTFTVLDTTATTVTFYIEITGHDGRKCQLTQKVTLPECHWQAERGAHTDTPTDKVTQIVNSMLVYPNPASQLVHVAYNYGNQPYGEKSIAVFDAMGRKIAATAVTTINGDWIVNTADWSPGMYVIRMEADGQPLQTQRLIVNN